ncbi:MAG: hypothetical protein EOL92_00480 [Bacteroidia bacterium]|nr:hypothetical protein [Bacteroidia bacterium]
MDQPNNALRAEITAIFARAGIAPGQSARGSAPVISPGQRAAADTDGNLRWVLTTEQPATVWDWERFDFVAEVLRMEGLRLPAVGQVPLLDSHARGSVDDQLGSVTDFARATSGDFAAIDGLTRWAADDKSQRTRQKVLDGHITDGSVGYLVTRSIWVPENTEAAIMGTIYRGPIKVSTEWELKEFSITPIGADTLAKVRGRLATCR